MLVSLIRTRDFESEKNCAILFIVFPPTVKQEMQESTAFGAAIAAALADGIEVWKISDLKLSREKFKPQISESGWFSPFN